MVYITSYHLSGRPPSLSFIQIPPWRSLIPVCWNHLHRFEGQTMMNFPDNSNAHNFSFPIHLLFFLSVFQKFFPMGGVALLIWLWTQWIEMLPHSMLCPGTELIFSIQISLLDLLQYVVLANRNFQYTSLNSIVASLTLFPVGEGKFVLVLFQWNSVGNVLKKMAFYGGLTGCSPKTMWKGKE